MKLKTRSLVFEVGTEELPVSYFKGAKTELETSARTVFSQERLSFNEIKVIGTPRRITLLVSSLAEKQASETREVRGPAKHAAYDKDENPTKALLGFAKSQGVELNNIITRGEAGKEYVFAVVHDDGKLTADLLPLILPKLILKLSFPKVMRWEGEVSGDKLDILFARPIRWLLCLYGDEVIPVKIGKLTASQNTQGHRFLHPSSIRIDNTEQYEAALKKGYVLVNNEERKAQIKKALIADADNLNGKLYEDAAGSLLEELTHLVEYPYVFKGSFEERFLSLPSKVLTTVMIHHQRYVPLESVSGKKALLPVFLGVRNGNDNHIQTVIAGNERVLRARLADAVYFFKKDKETPLADRTTELDRLVFQKDLGTYGAKTRRIEKLCNWLIDNIKILDGNKVKSIEKHTNNHDITKNILKTASLCKTDLTTQMVFELPELQGVMGRIYALESGEPYEIAQGIEEHYLPRGVDSKMPVTMEGIIVGLADRADTLAGCFGLGLNPSGSRDPYGLRRAALGIINVILHHNIIINFRKLFHEAFQCYLDERVIKQDGFNNGTLALREFVLGRIEGELLSRFQAESKQNDLSLFMLENAYPWEQSKDKRIEYNLVYVVNKISVISNARKNQPEKFALLIMTAVRIANIIKKSFDSQDITDTAIATIDSGSINKALLLEPEEEELLDTLNRCKQRYKEAIENRRFADAWNILYQFISPINNFFDKVLVMDPDESIRQNRVRLLGIINEMFTPFGDLSKIILE